MREKPVILVADDDVVVRAVAREWLERAGFFVEEAVDGDQAVAVWTKCEPDLVLLDVLMPKADGYSVCSHMSRSEIGKNTPIFIMTALDDLDSINRAYEAGATAFTIKPISWAVEIHRIQYMLRSAKAHKDLHLSEEQLRQSQKMEAVGRLAAGVAHDFNNMLTAIDGFTSIAILESEAGNDISDFLDEVRSASARAATLTTQLLAFGRQQVLQPTVLRLNDTVEEMSKMLCRLINENIEFVTDTDAELWPVIADAGQIEQVIMNLVVNAGDVMYEGGQLFVETTNVVLDASYCRTHTQLEPGPYVQIAVSDTGIGMDTETIEQIFEPFFTTKEPGKGTGLGLSTVFGIVKQSGGHVCVDSELGKGTTFRVYLPRACTDDMIVTEVPRRMPSQLHGTGVILVVEDEGCVRRVIIRTLELNGYTVLSAADGQEAIELAQTENDHIDLLITDLMMPKIGGLHLVEELVKQRPEIRVLFTSGYAGNHVLSESAFQHDAAFLQKPFALELLLDTVKKVLGRTVRETQLL